MKKKQAFVVGGVAAIAEMPVTPVPSGMRITKTIRMAQSIEMRLKEEAFKRSMLEGKRVAESDLIEEALIKYLNI